MSGIYIHIPFCKQACHYCDFHFSTSLKRKEEMIQAILMELEMRKNQWKRPIETIYFGGGTPSVLSVEEIQKILDSIYQNFQVAVDPEITLEANPDDLSSQKIKELSQTKINRLSIGVQSFFDDDLQTMNRSHNAEQAIKSLSEVTDHFDNFTIDLIYGIPEMTKQKWLKNLQIAFDLGVPHISSYALTVEDKTALSNFIKKGKYPPLDEKLAEQHFNILVSQTKDRDFIQYEISNFGKEGYFSKHNTSYWEGKHYLGIGPSAHSFNGISRSWNIANNAKYMASIQNEVLAHEIEVLSKNNQFNEAIMTGLRTIWGVSLPKIESQFGIAFKELLIKNAQKHLQNKTLTITNNKLLITEKGKFLADGIAADLFLV